MYGVFNVMIVLTIFSAIINLALWLPAHANAPIIVFAILYGFASGCTLSILPAMVAKLSDVRKLGVRNGALYAVASTGVLVGSPIGGAIQSRQHGAYSGLIIFGGVCLAVGAAFAVFSRTVQVGLTVRAKI
jgi:predicted MFS family arabinose efflux permease